MEEWFSKCLAENIILLQITNNLIFTYIFLIFYSFIIGIEFLFIILYRRHKI